jgi:hypothetical protein
MMPRRVPVVTMLREAGRSKLTEKTEIDRRRRRRRRGPEAWSKTPRHIFTSSQLDGLCSTEADLSEDQIGARLLRVGSSCLELPVQACATSRHTEQFCCSTYVKPRVVCVARGSGGLLAPAETALSQRQGLIARSNTREGTRGAGTTVGLRVSSIKCTPVWLLARDSS